MSQLIVLQGLPGSGKSTRALAILHKNKKAIRLNKDLLRELLFGVKKNRKDPDSLKWSGAIEKQVFSIQKDLAKHYLDNHYMVIIDDTNLNPKTFKSWEKLAQENNHTFKLEKIETDVDECIRRDAKREDSVGKEVIMWFAQQYGFIEEKYDIPKEGRIAIFDLDGTIFNIDHRLHFIKNGKKDWDGFFDAMDKDTLREGVASLIDTTYKDHVIILVTGRPATYMEKTINSLKKNNVRYDTLLMRKVNDHRPDYIIKEEILNKFIPKDRVDIVVDDRAQVLEMWKKNGLSVINVGGENNNF